LIFDAHHADYLVQLFSGNLSNDGADRAAALAAENVVHPAAVDNERLETKDNLDAGGRLAT
jgi:hypothetical protein